MKYVTKHTVKLDAETFPPGTSVEIKDKKMAQKLLDQGAIAEEMMTVSEATRRAAAQKAEEDGNGKGKAGKGAASEKANG